MTFTAEDEATAHPLWKDRSFRTLLLATQPSPPRLWPPFAGPLVVPSPSRRLGGRGGKRAADRDAGGRAMAGGHLLPGSG